MNIKIGNSTLMAQCGGSIVTSEFLRTLKTPEAKGRHYPTPFNTFYKATRQSLTEYGFQVKEAAHCLSHENQRYFGLMSVAIPRRYSFGDTYIMPDGQPFKLIQRSVDYERSAPQGYSLWFGRVNDQIESINPVPDYIADNPVFEHIVGLRSSWDQTFSNQLVMGSRVFVCDNLAFSGQIMIRRKNTLRAIQQLPGMVDKAVARIDCLRVDEEKRVQAYLDAPVTLDAAKASIVDVCKSGGIGGAKLLKVLGEIEEPTHEEHLHNGERTVWTVKNAFTEVFKEYTLTSLPARSASVNKVLDRVAGFVPATAAVIDID